MKRIIYATQATFYGKTKTSKFWAINPLQLNLAGQGFVGASVWTIPRTRVDTAGHPWSLSATSQGGGSFHLGSHLLNQATMKAKTAVMCESGTLMSLVVANTKPNCSNEKNNK